MKRPSWSKYYAYLVKNGHAFEANLVATRHSNPTEKLRGLSALVQRGHSVRTGMFSDDLVVDGEKYPWVKLESVK